MGHMASENSLRLVSNGRHAGSMTTCKNLVHAETSFGPTDSRSVCLCVGAAATARARVGIRDKGRRLMYMTVTDAT